MCVKCFLVERTGRSEMWFLRGGRLDRPCGATVGGSGYCSARAFVGEIPTGPLGGRPADWEERSDPRWPTACERCGRLFDGQDDDAANGLAYYVQMPEIWENRERGARGLLRLLPAGAMAVVDPVLPELGGDDGKRIECVLPDGSWWSPDQIASNCPIPHDKTHKCWPRRGTPPHLTVDKAYGKTCSAGANSILTPNWHGYLRDGEFVE